MEAVGVRNDVEKVFFFFQAEDGFGVKHVTGVQTCALPIWRVDEEKAMRRAEFAERQKERLEAEQEARRREKADRAESIAREAQIT